MYWPEIDLHRDSRSSTLAVYRSGVETNAIECLQDKFWVHKQCSGLKGRRVAIPDHVCSRWCGTATATDCKPVTDVCVEGTLIDVKGSFCYLGDMLVACEGCTFAIITRCWTAWGKFKKHFPVETSKQISWQLKRICWMTAYVQRCCIEVKHKHQQHKTYRGSTWMSEQWAIGSVVLS